MPDAEYVYSEAAIRDATAKRRIAAGTEQRKYCFTHHAYSCTNPDHAVSPHWARFLIGLGSAVLTLAGGAIVLTLWQAWGWWLLIGIAGIFAGLLAVYAYGWMIIAVGRLLTKDKEGT